MLWICFSSMVITVEVLCLQWFNFKSCEPLNMHISSNMHISFSLQLVLRWPCAVDKVIRSSYKLIVSLPMQKSFLQGHIKQNAFLFCFRTSSFWFETMAAGWRLEHPSVTMSSACPWSPLSWCSWVCPKSSPPPQSLEIDDHAIVNTADISAMHPPLYHHCY